MKHYVFNLTRATRLSSECRLLVTLLLYFYLNWAFIVLKVFL
uniref:Uncharacterized protein n=1 Tax=Siphoviridae sp. ctWuM9 TaxID=2826364 RepID=A0A8S5MF34_9CAUD|nr:MAG TPA: hypothetical protein [Siphoviridae sp. ctWuM9]DAP16530.1 MAG TPA: hypothetical protein [Caudoviricetes sp.]